MLPLISVVMPAYNSEKTIEKALASIRMQNIPAEQVEILVIDGGSTDATCEIAKKYGVVIIQNPYRLPEPAKLIGIKHASGRYIIWQDTDEVLIKKDQLQKRLDFLKRNPNVCCMVCDNQYSGEHCGIAASYLCACGDPFTQFVYNRHGGVVATFVKNINCFSSEGCVFQFKKGDTTPIGDGGTTLFDLQWVKNNFPDVWDTQKFVCSIFGEICETTGYCGCIPNDDIIHYAKASFFTYLAKLKFRVINNLFYPEESGYKARTRETAKSKISIRQYTFILYAITLMGPLYDSIRLSLKNHDARFLLHTIYVYYVCMCIAVCIWKKCIGRTPQNTTYGKSVSN